MQQHDADHATTVRLARHRPAAAPLLRLQAPQPLHQPPRLRQRPSQRRPRAGSTSSLTTTSSKSEFNSSIVSNTLLATSSHRSSTRQRQRHTNFLDFFNTDPCHLFKRKHNRLTNIGHVNHLGRYTSCVSRPPEGDKASGRAAKAAADTVPMSRKLTHAMKRLVVSESEEQYREEMSWQMAELIVSEVLKLSKPSSS